MSYLLLWIGRRYAAFVSCHNYWLQIGPRYTAELVDELDLLQIGRRYAALFSCHVSLLQIGYRYAASLVDELDLLQIGYRYANVGHGFVDSRIAANYL